MSEENYFKDVKKSTFYLDWIPFSVVGFLLALVTYIMFFVTLHILFDKNFILRDYLPHKLCSIEMVVVCIILVYSIFASERKMFRMTKKKPFALVSDERLFLNFGRDSFLWDSIQSVDLEGGRKLIVIYSDDKGKLKSRVNDLKWLSKKEDFIHNLKNNCSKRNIPYREVGMTYSSQFVFYLIIMKRFLFEPELIKE